MDIKNKKEFRIYFYFIFHCPKLSVHSRVRENDSYKVNY